MTRVVEVTLETVTPLFTGGPQADLQLEWDGQRYKARRGTTTPRAELRTEIIKGLLAFWYRALHPEEIPERAEELRIFGTSAALTGGSAVFRLESEHYRNRFTNQAGDLFEIARPQAALAAVGPLEPGFFPRGNSIKQLPREAIPPSTSLSLRFRFGPRARQDDIDRVLQSLWALATFGGLGARSRHGWGSVHIREIRIDGQPSQDHANLVGEFPSVEAFSDQVQANLASFGGISVSGWPDRAILSNKTRILLRSGEARWDRAVVNARGYLQTWQRQNITDSGHPPRDHHTLVRDFLSGPAATKPSEATIRDVLTQIAVFGLPIIYRDAAGRRTIASLTASHRDASGRLIDSRRASPLFLSIAKIGEQWHGLWTFPQGRFLPSSYEFRLKPVLKPWSIPGTGVTYDPITAYLNDLQAVAGTVKIL